MSIFNFGSFKRCINKCIYPAHMYGLCIKCLYIHKQIYEILDKEIFNIDINIFNYETNIKSDKTYTIQTINEQIDRERVDDNIRFENAYNICKVFGCMFMTRKNFCSKHKNCINYIKDYKKYM